VTSYAVPPAAPADGDSAEWLAALRPGAAGRDRAVARLHDLLLRAARTELSRRASRSQVAGKELDDLAHQAAADALMSIIRRLDTFRGDSRFTTWAYKFAILEVSSKLGRHFWNHPDVALEPEQWERLPQRFGLTPDDATQAAALFAAVRRAVDTALTEHQRTVFVALVVDAIPLDALTVRMGTNRNAVYKVMFDARRKIRAALVTDGYLT
jgi:RNA polymerase sigma-70 factor, ECF subfamily